MNMDHDHNTDTTGRGGASSRPLWGTMRVLFVCLGNICRSPTAHAVLRAKARAGLDRGQRGHGRLACRRPARPARGGRGRGARLPDGRSARATGHAGRFRPLRPDAGDGPQQPAQQLAMPRALHARSRLFLEHTSTAPRRHAGPVLQRRLRPGLRHDRKRPRRLVRRAPDRRASAPGAVLFGRGAEGTVPPPEFVVARAFRHAHRLRAIRVRKKRAARRCSDRVSVVCATLSMQRHSARVACDRSDRRQAVFDRAGERGAADQHEPRSPPAERMFHVTSADVLCAAADPDDHGCN